MKITDIKEKHSKSIYTINEFNERVRILTDVEVNRKVISAKFSIRILNFIIDITILILSLSVISKILDDLFLLKSAKLYLQLSSPIILILYYTFTEYKFQQTLGKFLTNTYVINEYADKITLYQAFIRNLNKPAIFISRFFFISYFEGKSTDQLPHDIQSNTWCVTGDEYNYLLSKLNDNIA